ncbi:DegV family protein [Alteribacter aurantiacus]|uniref:DegV family protein n=1 Tax=Alteribacter aurantiacus TaxID=254410 RepID=UPI0003F50542|nr:DegV family protein [Alteribacter aurantiacus]
MSKIAILTDSTSYLTKDIRDQHNIEMIPLNVVFGQEEYKEEVEITTEQFYEEMKEKEMLPKTSQPSVGLFEETYQRLAETHDHIIVITLSSGISGTYQTAVSAANMTENVDVRVFDSEISCMPQGFFALTASKMVAEGKEVSDILDYLHMMRDNMRAYFMADDLSHLHRGGRLNGAQLVVGSLLQIKPVLHFQDKVIVPFEKVRTAKKALTRIKDLLDEDASSGDPLDITVIHANRPEKAEEIAAELREKYPNATVYISYFGPVIGTHLGEGSLGVGWVKTNLTA